MKWRPISSVRFPDTIGLGDDKLVYDEAYGIVVAAPETARKGERRIWAHGHKLTMATHGNLCQRLPSLKFKTTSNALIP